MEGIIFLKKHCRWMIVNDEDIKVMNESWTSSGLSVNPTAPLSADMKVSDLLMLCSNSTKWDFEKVKSLFDPPSVCRILATPVNPAWTKDYRIWPYNQKMVIT